MKLYKKQFKEELQDSSTVQTVDELLKLIKTKNIPLNTKISIKGSIGGPIQAYIESDSIILD